jgi:integrase/recombinase XerD
MKVQRIRLSNAQKSWTVVDKQRRAIAPIGDFLAFQEALGRSPNTVRAYAHHLKTWWQYLDSVGPLDWQAATREELVNFINWLRTEKPRQPSTINAIVAGVIAYYDYHDQREERPPRFGCHNRRQNWALGVANSRQPKLALPVPKSPPQTLAQDEALTLINACRLKRDKFLLTLLYQTGMRIGQALGLRHEDIDSEENLIRIVPRNNNANGMRAKTHDEYVVHVSAHLIEMYTDYLLNEYPTESDNDYVFAALQGKWRGRPLSYTAVTSLFKRLAKKTGIITHPHAFRHTHVTQLFQAGVEPRVIQERVGHKSIQTTMETYTHLTAADVKREFQDKGIL